MIKSVKKCIGCSKELKSHRGAIRCRSCNNRLRGEKKEKVCEICGNNFLQTFRSAESWSKARFCSIECRKNQKKPKVCLMCNRVFLKMSEYSVKSWNDKAQFCSRECKDCFFVGENSINWKGGITSLYRRIRSCRTYLNWKGGILKRDKYACVFCNCNKNLNVDHIKAFSEIIEKNKIKTVKEARNCEELWKADNGRTLCYDCHKTTYNWGSKVWKFLELSSRQNTVIKI